MVDIVFGLELQTPVIKINKVLDQVKRIGYFMMAMDIIMAKTG